MKKLFFLLSLALPCYSQTPTDFLKELVEIESGSNQSSNVNKIQDHIEKKLKNLGFRINRQKDPAGKEGDLILADLKGKEKQIITLIVHSDTVFESESNFTGFKFSEDKLKASGPGVIDNKGGIVVMLTALERYLKLFPEPKYSLRVLSSPSEEIGSPAFVKNFKAYGDETSLVLSFEPSQDNGAIVVSRRGNRWFHIKTKGKEAHAGRSFKDGVNACVEMSRISVEIAKLTNYDKNLTLNIGRISGGQDKFNIVCGEAEIKVDTRFSSVKVRDEMQTRIDQIIKASNKRQEKLGIKEATTYSIVDDSPPYSPEKQTQRYVDLYLGQIKRIEGKDPGFRFSGASADANYLARPGLVIMDGLGPTGADMHTNVESVLLSSLSSRANAFVGFMTELEKGKLALPQALK